MLHRGGVGVVVIREMWVLRGAGDSIMVVYKGNLSDACLIAALAVEQQGRARLDGR